MWSTTMRPLQWVCQPAPVSISSGGNATIPTNEIDGGSADNCGVEVLSASVSTFTCSDIGGINDRREWQCQYLHD